MKERDKVDFMAMVTPRFFRGLTEIRDHRSCKEYCPCLFDRKKRELFVFERPYDLARAVFLLCTEETEDQVEPYRIVNLPARKKCTSEPRLDDQEDWSDFRDELYSKYDFPENRKEEAIVLNEEFFEMAGDGDVREKAEFSLSDFGEHLDDIAKEDIKKFRLIPLKRMAMLHRKMEEEIALVFKPELKKKNGLVGITEICDAPFLN